MAETSKLHRVYSIVPRKGKKDYWLNLGMAFPHDDGKGWNVLLQAVPLPWNGECKIVIREKAPEDAETSDGDTKPNK